MQEKSKKNNKNIRKTVQKNFVTADLQWTIEFAEMIIYTMYRRSVLCI